MEILLVLAAVFLAYANGANDNFKGVATLLGSHTVSYGQALAWTTTTHGLTGALVGAGLVAVWTDVRVTTLGSAFFLPLLVSPLLAAGATFGIYPVLRFLRKRLGVEKETCICLDSASSPVPIHALALLNPALPLRVDTLDACVERYAGKMLGFGAQRTLDWLHFSSAGAVSFSRGLNDTPKIVALLTGAQLLDVGWGSLAVGLAMAAGGLLNARRVAETMSYRITEMNPGQGFTANLITALMVLGASRAGVPVSTTHVSCGSLFGLGMATGEAHRRTITGIVLAWGITLPVAAVLAGSAFWILSG